MIMFYHYDKEKNIITIPKSWRKIKDGVRVYLYGSCKYEYAYADRPKDGLLDWLDKYNDIIDRVEIKVPKLFGLLGYKWVVLEDVDNYIKIT